MGPKNFLSNSGAVEHLTLEGFVKQNELTPEQFLRGESSHRAMHASGGNVETVANMPNWASGQNPSPNRDGGEILYDWKGGANNKRVMRKTGGSIESGTKSTGDDILAVFKKVLDQ